MVSTPRQESNRRLDVKASTFPLLVAAICSLAIIPFALVRFPPINDYPFHLARIVILAHLGHSGFAQFYSLGTFLLPDVALDAIAVPLGWLTGPEAAVRIFVELTLVLLILGTVTLNAVVHRASAWPLLGASVAYNGIFRFGFFNYLFGLALALFALALWLRMRGVPKLVVGFGSCVILIFSHMEAFGLFALAAAGIELERAFSDWRRGWSWAPVWQLLTAATPFVVTMAGFLLVSPTAHVTSKLQYAAGWGTKPVSAVFSLSSGFLWLDATTVFAILALGIWFALRGWLSFSRPVAVSAALLLMALIVLPPTMMGSIYADSRLGPAIALLALASFGIASRAPRVATFTAGGVALALAALHTLVLSSAWLRYEGEIRPIVQALDTVPEGSTVFALTSEPYPRLLADSKERQTAWRPPLKHVASYAVLHGAVFVPMTFADPTKQPLVVSPSYADVKNYQGDNPFLIPDRRSLLHQLADIRGHASSWKVGMPYALVVGRKALEPLTLPGWAVPVAAGQRFVLLRLEAGAPQ